MLTIIGASVAVINIFCLMIFAEKGSFKLVTILTVLALIGFGLAIAGAVISEPQSSHNSISSVSNITVIIDGKEYYLKEK